MDDKPEKFTCRAALLNKNKKAIWSYYILPPYHCRKGEGDAVKMDELKEERCLQKNKLSNF